MYVVDLVVEPGREDHIARHGVTLREVNEVFTHRSFARRERQGYFRVIGTTAEGRYLAVFVVALGRGVYSLVTARDATSAERRLLSQGRGR